MGDGHELQKPSHTVRADSGFTFADAFDGGKNQMSAAAKKQDIENFIGKKISLPDSWSRSERHLGGHAALTSFSSPNDDATFSLYDRGNKLDDRSASYFKKLLDDNKSIDKPVVLMPTQIRELANVMGTSNAGDNQYTNTHRAPDPKAPAFHLSGAKLISLNGHTVLEVDGNYLDADGKPTNQYKGIFVNANQDASTVKEFFLQTQTVGTMAKHAKDYRETLNSIEW